jgi:D-xylose 1-dehydrogenase (NADP+, D-xylono-1,5-lactone-forming)
MKPVRWGVLGCARVFERRMVPAFGAAPEAELIAVASRSEEKARATAEKHSIPRFFGSYDALLADPDVEAVFLPLPNDQHAHWTKKALLAGKHVLCDKPMTLSVSDAEANAALAREKNLRLMEGFMFRFHPQHTRVKEIAASGAIGAVTRFEASFGYPATPDRTNIRWNKAQGGGALLDVGVYGISAARYFLGEPTDGHVFQTVEPDSGVDLASLATFVFPSGVLASVACSFAEAFSSTYKLIGTAGSIVAERAFQIGESGVNLRIRAHNANDETVEFFPHVDSYTLELSHFSACVRDPQRSLSPGEDGVAQAQAVALALSP